jgi:2'-5' RNA ligase
MTAGTSSGRHQSAILIPVHEADAVVAGFRLEHDPVATAGVPAHITLIVPWLPPVEIRPEDLDELAAVVQTRHAFDFSLARVRWFGRRVLWLAPDPVEPFLELVYLLAEHFGTPPYEDEFDEVVPHLTVGHASDGAELGAVADLLAPKLPISCRADQVWVMEGDGQTWSVREKMSLPAT